MSQSLSLADLESVYETLANAINQAGTDKDMLFMTKLALLLANELGDKKRFEDNINKALLDL